MESTSSWPFAGAVARSRITPREPGIPLSVILMPAPKEGPRPSIPDSIPPGTRPPFPGQQGRALAAIVVLLSALAAVVILAAGPAIAARATSRHPVGPGLANLLSPISRVASGAPSPHPSSSLAPAGWQRERAARRKRPLFIASSTES